MTPYVFSSALTLDTSQYAAGDTLGDLLEVTNVVRRAGERAVLQSVFVIDKSDQGAAFDLVLFDRSVTLSAKNAAWNTSDDDMAFAQALVRVTGSDYVDLGGNRIAQLGELRRGVKPNATSLYLGTVSQGTGTYAAAGLLVVLTFLR